jgi:multidrug efflux pump subunit AcrA (membrane-fusion protein)
VEVVCRHSSTALANAMEHQDLFLMPVWRALGKARWIVGARTLPKTLTISAAVLALVAALCLWPYDFQVESKGTLEPVVRRDVFAGIDGVVVDVPAQHGKRVAAGETLVRLRNTDAEQAMTQVEGQRLVAIERIDSLRRTLLEERQLRPEERARVSGELAEEQEKLINLDAQQVICRKRIDELEVHSPIRGQVVTWDVDNRLKRRPVTRGQTLLRVADPDGPWQLELHVPENDMGFIASAQRNPDNEPGLGKDLKVTYILATQPGTKYYGKVTEVARSAEVRGEEGNTVLVKVAIDKNDLSDPIPGATVTAKVYCGRRPIGYVFFHSVIAYIQARLLFRL